jgi:hypothetical protein
MALPLPKAFWPITIVVGVNDALDARNSADDPIPATIAPGTYYSAADLAAAVKAALDATGFTLFNVSVTATGRFSIDRTNNLFDLLFATGPRVASSIHPLLGYASADRMNVTAAQVSNSQHQNGWYAEDPVADDTGDLPSFTRAQTRALGGHVKSVQFGDALYDRSVSLQFLPEYKVFKALEGATYVNEALERLIESGWARFRWWPDASAEGTWTDYVLELESARKLLRDRLSPGMSRYAYPLRFLKYVSAGDPAVLPAAGFDASLLY